MRICIIILLLFFSAQVGASEAYLDKEAGISFPQQVAGFDFIGKREYGSNGLGYGINYASEDVFFATVIVYDLGEKGIVDGVTHPFVRQQFQQAQKEIEKTYRSVRKLNESINTELSCLKVGYALLGPSGERARVYLFIRGQAGKVVKIRVTTLSSENIRSRVSKFLDAMSKVIVSKGDNSESIKENEQLSTQAQQVYVQDRKEFVTKRVAEEPISVEEKAKILSQDWLYIGAAPAEQAVKSYYKDYSSHQDRILEAILTGIQQDKLLQEANVGDASAQFSLGVMYYEGKGIKDYEVAAKWFKKAANQGHAIAQYNLGSMYYNGQGVTQNYVYAHMWWNLAAVNGDKDASKNRGLVAKKMTAAQVERAQELAREWKPKK